MKRLLLVFAMALALGGSIVEARGIAQFIPPEWSDLFAPWAGAKMAINGADPYSARATEDIQRRYYGYVLEPGTQKDQQAFVYPLHAVFFLAPLTALRWPAVRLLFTLLGPLCLGATAWIWIRLCRFPCNGVQLAAVLVLVLTCWPAVWGYLTQQPTLMVVAALTGALFLYQRGWDALAGLLLAAATVKPNVAGPLVLWLVLLAMGTRRWRFLLALGGSLSGLLLGSELLDPGWFGRWVGVARGYSSSPERGLVLLHLLGTNGGVLATTALVLGTCFYLWRLGAVRVESPEFIRAAALVLAVTACIIPDETWMIYNQVLLIPSALLVLRARPAAGWGQLLRWPGLFAIYATLLIMPACATLLTIVGYNKILVLLPFQTLFVSPLLAVSLLGLLANGFEAADSLPGELLSATGLAITEAVAG